MDKKSSLTVKNLRKNEQNHQNQKSEYPLDAVVHCKKTLVLIRKFKKISKNNRTLE